jgi:hypothetical protein
MLPVTGHCVHQEADLTCDGRAGSPRLGCLVCCPIPVSVVLSQVSGILQRDLRSAFERWRGEGSRDGSDYEASAPASRHPIAGARILLQPLSWQHSPAAASRDRHATRLMQPRRS